MQFFRVGLSGLLDIVVPESYPGGSHSESHQGLRRYILSKTIDGKAVREIFNHCFWANVSNVMRAEDKLLKNGTLWNLHGRSNLDEAPGYVYVLRKRAPARRNTTGSDGARRCGCSGCGSCTSPRRTCTTQMRTARVRICSYCFASRP